MLGEYFVSPRGQLERLSRHNLTLTCNSFHEHKMLFFNPLISAMIIIDFYSKSHFASHRIQKSQAKQFFCDFLTPKKIRQNAQFKKKTLIFIRKIKTRDVLDI
jgi:hypothetical protein